MPLPATPYYIERLNTLRAISPRAAELAEQIVLVFKLKALNQLVDVHTAGLFDRLTEVARQDEAYMLHLGIWLLDLIELRALSPAEAVRFSDSAIALSSPSSGVDDELT